MVERLAAHYTVFVCCYTPLFKIIFVPEGTESSDVFIASKASSSGTEVGFHLDREICSALRELSLHDIRHHHQTVLRAMISEVTLRERQRTATFPTETFVAFPPRVVVWGIAAEM